MQHQSLQLNIIDEEKVVKLESSTRFVTWQLFHLFVETIQNTRLSEFINGTIQEEELRDVIFATLLFTDININNLMFYIFDEFKSSYVDMIDSDSLVELIYVMMIMSRDLLNLLSSDEVKDNTSTIVSESMTYEAMIFDLEMSISTNFNMSIFEIRKQEVLEVFYMIKMLKSYKVKDKSNVIKRDVTNDRSNPLHI